MFTQRAFIVNIRVSFSLKLVLKWFKSHGKWVKFLKFEVCWHPVKLKIDFIKLKMTKNFLTINNFLVNKPWEHIFKTMPKIMS